RAEVMGGDVGNGDGLTGGQRGELRCAGYVAGSLVAKRRLARLLQRELAAGPGARDGDGGSGAEIAGAGDFEVMQHVGGAVGCPVREEVMIVVGQRSAPPNRHEARISLLAEDHASAHVVLDIMARSRRQAA